MIVDILISQGRLTEVIKRLTIKENTILVGHDPKHIEFDTEPTFLPRNQTARLQHHCAHPLNVYRWNLAVFSPDGTQSETLTRLRNPLKTTPLISAH